MRVITIRYTFISIDIFRIGVMQMDEAYKGPERRIEQRRKKEDRRDMLRFEPTKTPRRSNKDRRIKSIWDDRNGF